MFSIWEKQSFLTTDVLILGAGITGLSAAASIKEADPSLQVTVLEKGVLPSGASTKNAGFACFGSVSELLNDIDTLGEDGMIALVERRIKGLAKTTNRLGASNIDLQVKGGYELLPSGSPALDEIARINRLLRPLYEDPIYSIADHRIEAFGLDMTDHLIENQYEGQLDTGKLMSVLWEYCGTLGIRIHTGCEVEHFEDQGTQVLVQGKELEIRAAKLVICTNAFTKQLVGPELDLAPGRGIVMQIKPAKPLRIDGTFHYDEGYYYFRDYYGKLLFGGGRNTDLEKEATTQFGINDKIKRKLLDDLEQIILPNQSYEVEHTWSGIMAFGANKSPIVKKMSENVVIGVRLGGMGVAIGSLVGEEVALLAMGD